MNVLDTRQLNTQAPSKEAVSLNKIELKKVSSTSSSYPWNRGGWRFSLFYKSGSMANYVHRVQCPVGLPPHSPRAQGSVAGQRGGERGAPWLQPLLQAASVTPRGSLSFAVSTFPLSSRGVVKTDSCLK